MARASTANIISRHKSHKTPVFLTFGGFTAQNVNYQFRVIYLATAELLTHATRHLISPPCALDTSQQRVIGAATYITVLPNTTKEVDLSQSAAQCFIRHTVVCVRSALEPLWLGHTLASALCAFN